MPKYWMITNRNADADSLGNHRTEKLRFYTADAGPIDQLGSWTLRSEKQFRTELAAVAPNFVTDRAGAKINLPAICGIALDCGQGFDGLVANFIGGFLLAQQRAEVGYSLSPRFRRSDDLIQ